MSFLDLISVSLSDSPSLTSLTILLLLLVLARPVESSDRREAGVFFCVLCVFCVSCVLWVSCVTGGGFVLLRCRGLGAGETVALRSWGFLRMRSSSSTLAPPTLLLSSVVCVSAKKEGKKEEKVSTRHNHRLKLYFPSFYVLQVFTCMRT